MSKTIKKALNILQFIAENPEKALSSGEIAAHLGLNSSTSVFLLNTLVECGYVDQEAPRKGYTLGPMAYFLGRNGPYRKDMINKARPLLEKLSKEINESVLIAVTHGNKRIVLCFIEGDQEVRVSRNRTLLDDFYQTATGNLLLANMSEADRNSYIARHGLPDQKWPEANTKKKMNAVLSTIRKDGMIIKDGTQAVQLAFTIEENNQFAAALGIPVPKFTFKGALKEKILNEAKKTAKAISEILSF